MTTASSRQRVIGPASGSMAALVLVAAVAFGLGLRPDGDVGAPVAGPSEGQPTAEPGPSQPPAPSAPLPAPTRPATPEPTPTPGPLEPTPAPTPVPQTPAPVAPPSHPGHGLLPECAYTDVLTPHHGLGEWRISLLDTIYHLPASYAPADLVDSSAAGLNGGYPIRTVMLDDLRAMASDARAAGAPLQIVSGYRNFEEQRATFDHWVRVGGYEQALRTSARPGHSEHQLGTAIDVTGEGGLAPWEYADWSTTPTGAWMAENAWRYGFVMSYPKGVSDLSCYAYEPWHYRYVGRELAAEVAGEGRILRQVLWEIQ